jgi:endonuclease YncB( thermonuclease family)
MNNVVKYRRPRRPTPFPMIVAAIMIIGASGGAAVHYGMRSGAIDKAIDTFMTAAVDITPVKATQREVKTPSTARRFSMCSGGHRVTCVVDGDTLWIDGVKIRIADINAPEVGKPLCAYEKQLGDKATRRLLQLVNIGPFEVLPSGDRDEDRYGRKLRVLVRGGRSLGDVLVAEGLAKTWIGHKEPWC